MPDIDETLYLVYIREPETGIDPAEFHHLLQLDDGVWLVRSGLSRSKIYHAFKHAARPAGLLVAPLAGHPKFKGMRDGALKALRSGF